MCVEIRNQDTRKYTDTPSGLADMLEIGVEQLPIQSIYKDLKLGADNCLCPVDIDKVCELFGYSWKYNDDFDILISKKQ